MTVEADRKGQRILSEPILLIEVLSPSNASDTYENIRAYATLPSVQELLVVHSTRIDVEMLRNSAGNVWPANPTVIGTGGMIDLETAGLKLPMADVYVGSHLDG